MNKRSAVAAACVAILLVATAALLWLQNRTPSQARTARLYADPATCAQCHADAAAGYARTGMAHSFYHPDASTTLNSPAKEQQFYHAKSGTYYSMTAHDGHSFQRRWQQGYDGKPENVEELQIDSIMGSGNHVRTYLHREQDGTLTELPLAWYAESGGHWGMNPGYDNAHPLTRRPIAYECMFCHNAYPEIPDTAHRDLSANAVYTGTLPEGIDCQRCHGPGQAHVTAAQTKGADVQKIRAPIVNPIRLNKERQMEVCEQCHLETTSRPLPDRIRHYDQQPFGYQAGASLDSFISYYTHDPAAGRTDNFEIVNGAYRLRQSRCFRESAGALTCETCHNPHNLQKGPSATQYYTNICMRCHAATLPTEIAQHKHPASNDCVSCHMPRRRTEDVVHAIMTDHLIQRRAPPAKELLAERAEVEETTATAYHGEVKRYHRGNAQTTNAEDSLYDAASQVIDSSNLQAGNPRLVEAIRTQHPKQSNFSIELGDAMRRSGDLQGAISAYRDALAIDPLSSRAQRRLGVALGSAGQSTEALAVLQRAIDREPQNALLWYEQALIESQQGNNTKAIADLHKALELKPGYADAQNNLGANLIQTGDIVGAETAFHAALTINPYDAGTRANLGRLYAGQSDWKQAAFHLQKAVTLDPALGSAHLDYATVLAQMQRLPEAQKEAEAAVQASPKSPQAHEVLGQMLSERGQTARARAEFEAALQLAPDLSPAQLDLALTMLQAGDLKGATPLLQQAERSPIPPVAQRAHELLQQMGAH
jgi:predicted CXXCH cytochrome family protein